MRLLLTWVDHGYAEGRDHAGPDPGPVVRLVEVGDVRYDAARVLCTRATRYGARTLAAVLRRDVDAVDTLELDVTDPSDHAQLFRALGPVIADLPADAEVDVLLSAGTPQAQTLWVVLVQAGLLRARMLQVIPPRFVPVPHPHPVREVRLDIEGFPEIRALRDEVARLRARLSDGADGLIGSSPPMQRLRERLARLAPSTLPVLIVGETGVGKERVARALHDRSGRAGPFLAESCGALTESLAESELFGHEAGAFTGAAGRHRGLFEAAHGGTLLLDEVGELSPRLQVRLLRVLQEGVVRPVGAERPIPVDVRILSATHRDLAAMVAAGTFREDLYYRLRGAELPVPALRDRPGDLEQLIAHALAAEALDLRVTADAWRALAAWTWPGNVRELLAEVRRWGVLCDRIVDVEDLGIGGLPPAGRMDGGRADVVRAVGPAGPRRLDEAVAEAERAAVTAALAAESGNLSAAARVLGVDRNTLKRKMAGFGLR
jgi:two-component system response regulator AtoC